MGHKRVVTRDPRLKTEIFAKVPAHPFAEDFLPTVAILRHRRIGVCLLKPWNIRVPLAIIGVNASWRGKKRIVDVKYHCRAATANVHGQKVRAVSRLTMPNLNCQNGMPAGMMQRHGRSSGLHPIF